jgi:glutathione S-transferase
MEITMTTSRPRLTYFDLAASRGEECRIALHLAGVDFEDHRLKRDEWLALKPTTPFGSLPVLEMPGHPPLAQSNAILVLIGRLHGLHPSDPHEAARHEAVLSYMEEMRGNVTPTLRITDEAEKKAAREKLASTYLPTWAGFLERQIGDGPFFAGAKLHVVDVKIYIGIRWFTSGALDHVPTTVFDGFPKIMRTFAAVRDDARVQAWLTRK